MSRQRLDHPIAEIDLAVVNCFESRHQAGECRLARTRRAQNIRHLARPELERCAVDRGDRAEAFHQSFQDDADHEVNATFQRMRKTGGKLAASRATPR